MSRGLLDYAARLVPRGAIFTVRQERAQGLGAFGLDRGPTSGGDGIRDLVVPLAEPSVLSEVARRKALCRGPLLPTSRNHGLHRDLGGDLPADVIVVPLIVAARTVAILYGDNLPERRPIPPSDGLEPLMDQAGLALEKKSSPTSPGD